MRAPRLDRWPQPKLSPNPVTPDHGAELVFLDLESQVTSQTPHNFEHMVISPAFLVLAANRQHLKRIRRSHWQLANAHIQETLILHPLADFRTARAEIINDMLYEPLAINLVGMFCRAIPVVRIWIIHRFI